MESESFGILQFPQKGASALPLAGTVAFSLEARRNEEHTWGPSFRDEQTTYGTEYRFLDPWPRHPESISPASREVGAPTCLRYRNTARIWADPKSRFQDFQDQDAYHKEHGSTSCVLCEDAHLSCSQRAARGEAVEVWSQGWAVRYSFFSFFSGTCQGFHCGFFSFSLQNQPKGYSLKNCIPTAPAGCWRDPDTLRLCPKSCGSCAGLWPGPRVPRCSDVQKDCCLRCGKGRGCPFWMVITPQRVGSGCIRAAFFGVPIFEESRGNHPQKQFREQPRVVSLYLL